MLKELTVGYLISEIVNRIIFKVLSIVIVDTLIDCAFRNWLINEFFFEIL